MRLHKQDAALVMIEPWWEQNNTPYDDRYRTFRQALMDEGIEVVEIPRKLSPEIEKHLAWYRSSDY